MIQVSITRLWWISMLFLALCFAAKFLAFQWWRLNMVDAVIGVVAVWVTVVLSSELMNKTLEIVNFVRWCRMGMAVLICVAWCIAAIPVVCSFLVILAVMYLADAASARRLK